MHILIRAISQMRKMIRDDIVGEDFELVMLFPVIEDLKGAEAHMRWRHPHKHRAGFDLFSVDPMVAPDETERPSRRDPKTMHRFAAEILSDSRTQHRPAIAVARKRRKPRTFQMQIPLFAPLIAYLPKQDRAPVSQLRDIDSKLMARIEHGQRLHPRHKETPSKHPGKLRTLRLLRIKVDQLGRFGIETDKIWR